MTGIQIQESQIPQELRNLQPSVNMGDSILITEIHECLGAYCDDAQGRVKKFSGMTLGGTLATTEDGVFAKSWVKVNEPAEVGDRILVLRDNPNNPRVRAGDIRLAGIVSSFNPSSWLGLVGVGSDDLIRDWVKLPPVAKSSTPTTFKAGDVVRYEEPQAPFQVGDWVKDVSDNDRIGKVSEDVSFQVNVKYTDNHRGAFKVEYVDGKPAQFGYRYAFGRELEKLEVNPKVQVGDYITVLERAYWGNQEVDLPYTGRVERRPSIHRVSVPGDMPLVGRTYIKADTPMAQSSVDEPPFKIGDVVRYTDRTVRGGKASRYRVGTTGRVTDVRRGTYEPDAWFVELDDAGPRFYADRFDLVTEEKPAPKFKVGDLAVVNGKGNSWAIPEGSLVEITQVHQSDSYDGASFKLQHNGRGDFSRPIHQLDPWTELVQPGDKVVLTEDGISYITPGRIVDVVGTVAETNSIYHAIDGLWVKGNILLSPRTEFQKWTPQREAEARKFLAKLQAEQGEAAREKKLAELKQATVVKQDRYLYLSESGSHDWAEYKHNGENGIHSKHLICTDNPDADDYEIVK